MNYLYTKLQEERVILEVGWLPLGRKVGHPLSFLDWLVNLASPLLPIRTQCCNIFVTVPNI